MLSRDPAEEIDAGFLPGRIRRAAALRSSLGLPGPDTTVYRAVRNGDGVEIALKVLHPELAGDKTRVREFDHEARVTRSLSHPNIIRVIEYSPEMAPPLNAVVRRTSGTRNDT